MRHRRPIIVLLHTLVVLAAYAAAFALRFDGLPPSDAAAAFLDTVAILVVLRLLAFAALGLHRGFWKHFGLPDLITLVKAVSAGSVAFVVLLYAGGLLGAVPRSVIVLEWMLTLFFAGGVRLTARYVLEGRLARRNGRGKRVLVVGAGEAAERLLRQLSHDTTSHLHVVGLVDDDPGKQKRSLHGVPILGTIAQLPELVAAHAVQLVVVAISSAAPEQMRRIVDDCLAAKVEFKRLPSMREMLAAGAVAGTLEEVSLEHLLLREPVRFDEARVAADVAGSVVLITGGAGSVGSELARQIARARPARLVLVEQAESPLYFVHLDLARTHPAVDVVPVVADITDRAAMTRVFEQYRPAHVYHAAAYKHVPLMEANMGEAVRNNVHGTLCVAECAARSGARKFVLISTDKAVCPSSIMGATKRVAERIILGWPSLRDSGTAFHAVRFGNVLGSDGSVVPLFRRQLAAGGPLTVTHPDVRRYFMTIREAAQLVLHAATLDEAAGRITMLDMGEPVRILDLAENLVRLSGREPHRDVQITFTGLRPGEKLDEELISAVEVTVPTELEKVSVVQTDEVDVASVRQGVERLLAAATRNDDVGIRAALRELVPECTAPLRSHLAVAVGQAAPRERPARLARRLSIGP